MEPFSLKVHERYVVAMKNVDLLVFSFSMGVLFHLYKNDKRSLPAFLSGGIDFIFT
jgi:hypothetical protein